MPAFKGSVMNPAPGRNPCRFGEIPGFPVGSRWPGRRELCDAGVHAHLSGGIHGREQEGAFSVVLSGGYEDDVDLGYEFTYTGQGGQGKREKGVKWNNVQIEDQEWTRGNLSLAISCRKRSPVRVIRGHTLESAHAPSEGYRYDGLYTVEDADMKRGKSGFNVCLFRFVRCPNQVPLPGHRATLPMQPKQSICMNSRSLSNTGESSTQAGPSRLPIIKKEPSEEYNSPVQSSSPEPPATWMNSPHIKAPTLVFKKESPTISKPNLVAIHVDRQRSDKQRPSIFIPKQVQRSQYPGVGRARHIMEENLPSKEIMFSVSKKRRALSDEHFSKKRRTSTSPLTSESLEEGELAQKSTPSSNSLHSTTLNRDHHLVSEEGELTS